jgi:hypothetical protein
MPACRIINEKNTDMEKKEILSDILFVAMILLVTITMYVIVTNVTAGIINRL